MDPIRVAVTGGAGQIAYSLLFRIASGELFGKGKKVELNILEVKEALEFLKGVEMVILGTSPRGFRLMPAPGGLNNVVETVARRPAQDLTRLAIVGHQGRSVAGPARRSPRSPLGREPLGPA